MNNVVNCATESRLLILLNVYRSDYETLPKNAENSEKIEIKTLPANSL